MMFSNPIKILNQIGNRDILSQHGQMQGLYTSAAETVLQNGWSCRGLMIDSVGTHSVIGRKIITSADKTSYSLVYGTSNMLNFSGNCNFVAGNTVYYYTEQYGTRKTLATNAYVWDWSTDESTYNLDIVRIDKDFTDMIFTSGSVYIMLPTYTNNIVFSQGRKISFVTDRDNVHVCVNDSNFGIERIYGSTHSFCTYIKLDKYYMYDFYLTDYGWMVTRH